MTKDEWEHLAIGDIIQSKNSTLQFIVVSIQNGKVMVSCSAIATKRKAWNLIIKNGDRLERLQVIKQDDRNGAKR